VITVDSCDVPRKGVTCADSYLLDSQIHSELYKIYRSRWLINTDALLGSDRGEKNGKDLLQSQDCCKCVKMSLSTLTLAPKPSAGWRSNSCLEGVGTPYCALHWPAHVVPCLQDGARCHRAHYGSV